MNYNSENFTEDDTFRILARPNLDQMVELHAEFVYGWRKKHEGIYPTILNISFMRQHGWTWPEFLRAKKAAGYGT